MKVFQLGATITSTKLSTNALVLATGKFLPSVTGWQIQAEVLSGNEDLDETYQNYQGEKIIRDFKTADAVAGRWVVGLAPISVIQDEFAEFEIFSSVAHDTTATNLLFRGRLKESRTEAYTPAFLSYPHTILNV